MMHILWWHGAHRCYSMEKTMDVYKALKPVLDALLEERGLDSIMKAAYDVLGNPVILTDQALITLAFHAETPVDDLSWIDNVSHGYSSDEFVERFYREGIMDRIAHSAHPIIVDTGVGEQTRRMHCRVVVNHKTSADFGMLEVERPFNKQDPLLVEGICKILSLELQRTSTTDERPGGRHKRVLYSLLIGKNARTISRSIIKPKRLGDSKSFRILVIDNSLNPLESYYVNSIRRSIEYINPESVSFVIGEQQVLLLGSTNETLFEGRLGALEELLSKFDIYAGISSLFEDISDIRKYYLQAEEALRIGFSARTSAYQILPETPFPHVCRYADYLIMIMLSKLDSCSSLDDFIMPDLRKLAEYDQANGTNYKETLKKYHLNGQSIKAVAADMGLHRNTVAQRLAKISELLGADVLAGESAFKINLAFYIEDYLQLVQG